MTQMSVTDELRLDFSDSKIDLAGMRDELGDMRFSEEEMPFIRVLSERALEKALTELERIADIRDQVNDVVVVGIGGSSLGIQMLVSALKGELHLLKQGKRMFFLENVDPDTVTDVLSMVDLERSVFCVISKSGSTLETVSLMNAVFGTLKSKGLKLNDHIVFITDPGSKMDSLAQELKARVFHIVPEIGGRYSVLTNVGLVPIGLLGLDFMGVLEGAAEAYKAYKTPHEHPATVLGYIKAKHYLSGRRISVLMPYSDRLRKFASWYVQLWAESLGKAKDLNGNEVHVGPTPLPAVGTVDQHSLLQLFREGTDDKVYQLLRVESFDRDIVIEEGHILSYVAGKKLSEVMTAEFIGTLEALRDANRPIITLTLDRISPKSLGKLIFTYELATYAASRVLKVNPYDQPGVEFGKKVARRILEGGR